MTRNWAGDNSNHRRDGEKWERVYQRMLSEAGIPVERLDPASPLDFKSAGGYHETKHKDPVKGGFKRGCYGFEEYRVIQALAHSGRILYVIHDYMAAGASEEADDMPNRPMDWFAADLRELASLGPDYAESGLTYYAGRRELTVIWYWHALRFGHLESMLRPLAPSEGSYPRNWARVAAPDLLARAQATGTVYEPWIHTGQCAVCSGNHPACRPTRLGSGTCAVAGCRNPHHSARHELTRTWAAKAMRHMPADPSAYLGDRTN